MWNDWVSFRSNNTCCKISCFLKTTAKKLRGTNTLLVPPTWKLGDQSPPVPTIVAPMHSKVLPFSAASRLTAVLTLKSCYITDCWRWHSWGAEVRSGPPSQAFTIANEANGRVKLLSSITNPNPNVYPNPTQMFYLPVCHFCDSGPLNWYDGPLSRGWLTFFVIFWQWACTPQLRPVTDSPP